MTAIEERPATPAAAGLAKAYEPAAIEPGLYDRWDAAGYFLPAERPDRDPFVIVMPPPNLTGQLHIGHILTMTVEDVLIRWHRMLGDPTLWLPGADHAGIGGQWAVERELREEGLTRHDLGRACLAPGDELGPKRAQAFTNNMAAMRPVAGRSAALQGGARCPDCSASAASSINCASGSARSPPGRS